MSNVQIIKGGQAATLTLSASNVTGLNLADGQWCGAQVENGADTLLWEGPAAIPAAGASTTAGSGTLTQSAGGTFTIQYAATSGGQATSSETDSQIFLRQHGQLYGSQTFDLVDTASPPPAPAGPLTLTAAPQLIAGTPAITLTWSGG